MGFSYSFSKIKDGKLRFCIDLRKLNNRTLKDSYSLPRIEHVLDQLLGSTIFTTLDLNAGYWQVEMVEECKPYTTFTCGPLDFMNVKLCHLVQQMLQPHSRD